MACAVKYQHADLAQPGIDDDGRLNTTLIVLLTRAGLARAEVTVETRDPTLERQERLRSLWSQEAGARHLQS